MMYETYTVKQGDTLWRISRNFQVTVEQIKQLNGLTSNIIYPGQVLKIKEKTTQPTFLTHTVKKGDTLWALSQTYQVTVEEIKQLNGLTSNLTYPGQVLKIKEIQSDQNGYLLHTVVKGDTLWRLSQTYQVTVEQIQQLNGLTNNLIYPNQILKIKRLENTLPSKWLKEGNSSRKQVALTFDAGSSIEGIKILDVLRKHQIKCTFFLTGQWVEKYPQYAKQIVNDGHQISNHSYSHPSFPSLSYNAMLQEVKKAEEAIIKTTGINPRPLFRFPFGSSNTESLKAVGEAGYQYSIHWTIDTLDWKQPESDVIKSRIINNVENGGIVLMHVGGINTPKAVDETIPILKARGYELVTVSEIIKD
ncbi:LysM peptidoglycan-binding domain-containing protein [Bacillus timonensis]|nr:LysM peptidoglycan-binding domain-containing protein [Bacillus timonensis]